MYYFEQEDHLNEYLSKAILFHIVIVILLFVASMIADFAPFNINQKKEIKMIQTAVKIDIVALPKYTLAELEKIKINVRKVSDSVSQKNNVVNETSKIEFKKVQNKINMKNLLAKYSTEKVVKNKLPPAQSQHPQLPQS